MLSRRRAVALGFAALLAGAAGCGRKGGSNATLVPAGATVLAFGDSITWGTGAPPDASYPSVLARLTGWNVVNAGVPGNTSAQALERLPALLAEHRPALVLIGIGGNDFLRRLSEAETRANVERAARLAQEAGAQVLLIAVPRPTLAARVTGSLDDHPLYGEIAEALQIPLQRGGWAEVLADERLRADTIHANAAGYAAFAERLVASARAAGLLAR
jgi:acyl-CoA thioesterase-1